MRKTKTELEIETLVEGVKGVNNVVENTTENRKGRGKNHTSALEQYGGASYVDTKTRLKIYCDYNPRKQMEVLDAIIEQAKTNPKYAQLFVSMTGGVDPTETKITGEVTQVAESPLNSLDITELRTLKLLKSFQADGKLDDFEEFLNQKKRKLEKRQND